LLKFSAAFVAAVAVAVWQLRRDWAVIVVEGASMEPAYRDGDRVVIRRTPRFKSSPGDIVVVERPDIHFTWSHSPVRIGGDRRWMIKRVHARGGDPVPKGIPVLDSVVPEGQLVLLGDNASASFDSRTVGYFPAERVLGGVVRRMS
jgi:signal peptidase I